MLIFKRVVIFVLILIPVFLSGQEMTVEQSFLQQSIENMIIREMSRAEGREMKEVAMEFIGNAIERGNLSDEVRTSLEYMAFEGITNITMESGRVMNNHPMIRTQAATYLGMFNTVEATDALVRMVLNDNEPMVIAEAVRSLTTIGINEGNITESVSAIVWKLDYFSRTNPDDLLARAAIEAFERFAEINGYIDRSAVESVRRISTNGSYTRSVRERALQALNTMMWLPMTD